MRSPDDSSTSSSALAALAAVGLTACCGIPLLLAAGTGVTIAGLGIKSWVLITAGTSVAVVAGASHSRAPDACGRPAEETVDAD